MKLFSFIVLSLFFLSNNYYSQNNNSELTGILNLDSYEANKLVELNDNNLELSDKKKSVFFPD